MKIRGNAVNLITAALLFTTLGVAGCESNDTDPTTPADQTTTSTTNAAACPLDAAALSSAINIEMTRTSSARCGFVAASPQPGQVIEVYYTPIDAMIYEESEGEDVPGVGDGARWDTQMSGSLLVKTGTRHFSVQAVALGDLPEPLRPKNLATTVARMILTRAN